MVKPPAAGSGSMGLTTDERNIFCRQWAAEEEEAGTGCAGLAVQRAESTLQASLGDRICPLDQDHCVILASSSQNPAPARRAFAGAIGPAPIAPISGYNSV